MNELGVNLEGWRKGGLDWKVLALPRVDREEGPMKMCTTERNFT